MSEIRKKTSIHRNLLITSEESRERSFLDNYLFYFGFVTMGKMATLLYVGLVT